MLSLSKLWSLTSCGVVSNFYQERTTDLCTFRQPPQSKSEGLLLSHQGPHVFVRRKEEGTRSCRT